MIDESGLRACLAEQWGLRDVQVDVHNGGMGSATWYAARGSDRWVAKAVDPALGAQFAGGLSVATILDATGIPAGAPVPTLDGRSVVTVDAHPTALLTWVEGRALTGTGNGDQRIMGETLALVHQALRGVSVDRVQRFHWVRPEAGHLSIRPWIRPAVTAAVRALEVLGAASLTWGLLHCDPAPEHFRLDASSGRCGLIDWSVALEGPLLYDLASAVMYVGGLSCADQLVAAYLGRGALTAAEVEAALPVMLGFRWAVQADYFARRIAEHDLTGITGPADNEQGLEDARRGLSLGGWSQGTEGGPAV